MQLEQRFDARHPLETVETNLLEFLFEAGYELLLFDYRSSVDLPYSGELHTADDIARYDYAPAIAKVREVTEAQDVQVVAHCFGATTFTMAMLSGLQGVRSAVLCQIGPQVFVPWFPQRLLAYTRIPWFLGLLRLRALDVTSSKRDPRWLRVLDQVIYRLLPLSGRASSHNAVANRITALYGALYERDPLNDATFNEALPEMFGEARPESSRRRLGTPASAGTARRRRAARRTSFAGMARRHAPTHPG